MTTKKEIQEKLNQTIDERNELAAMLVSTFETEGQLNIFLNVWNNKTDPNRITKLSNFFNN